MLALGTCSTKWSRRWWEESRCHYALWSPARTSVDRQYLHSKIFILGLYYWVTTDPPEKNPFPQYWLPGLPMPTGSWVNTRVQVDRFSKPNQTLVLIHRCNLRHSTTQVSRPCLFSGKVMSQIHRISHWLAWFGLRMKNSSLERPYTH